MEEKGEKIEIQLMPEEVFLTPSGMLNFPMHFVSREAREEGVRWLWGSDHIKGIGEFESAHPEKALIIEKAATEWYNTLRKGVLDYKTLIAKAGPELYFAYAYLRRIAHVSLSDIKA